MRKIEVSVSLNLSGCIKKKIIEIDDDDDIDEIVEQTAFDMIYVSHREVTAHREVTE